jgi:hypothetical protein
MYQPDWKACFSFLVIAYLSIAIQPEKAAKFDSTKRDRVHCVRVSCVCVPGRDLAGSASALSLRQVPTKVPLGAIKRESEGARLAYGGRRNPMRAEVAGEGGAGGSGRAREGDGGGWARKRDGGGAGERERLRGCSRGG